MSYDTEVLADTPQIYWKLQDASGTSAVDSSGNVRPGTYNGTPTTHYALAQNVSLLSSDATLKSVALYRNGTHTVAKADISNATDNGGKANISRAYEAWMNVAGAAFSVECWARVPSTVTRYLPLTFNMVLAARRASVPAQWQMALATAGAMPSSIRWEAALAGGGTAQPAYGSSFFGRESAQDTLVSGTPTTGFEQATDDYIPASLVKDNVDDLAHHYVLACGLASMRQYQDGVLGAIYYTSGLPAIASNVADPILFGGSGTPAAPSTGLIGYMSHCAHYPSELSAARVAAHFTAGGSKIAFLNQQWTLLAGQTMTLAATSNATSSAGFIFAAQMALNPSVNATTNLLPAFRAGMALAAQANATTLLTPNAVLGVSFLSAGSIADSVTTSGFMQMVLSNIAGVASALGTNGVMGMTLADVVTAAIVLQAGDTVYNGWILNPNLAASTGLTDFAFNSFVKHKGRYYGMGAGGVYELGGPNDNGANINTFVGLPKLDFGTERLKHVPYAYIGVSSSSQLVLRVLVSGTVYTYIARNDSTEMAEQRVDIGKGLRSSYWQFEIVNTDGADFDLDTIKFVPIVLERRI